VGEAPAAEAGALAAGAAEVELQAVVTDYWERAGQQLRRAEAPWPQRLRCLVLEQDDRLLVIFNADWGRWLRLVDEARQEVEEKVPDRPVTVLCFPTQANHNIDFEGFYWGAFDVRSRRYDPALRSQVLAALRGVFADAVARLRPATVAVGRGTCEALAVNCYWGDGHTDPAVYVLRVADREGHPIAVLIHFACRGDDRVHGVVSAGFAGAAAAVVQRLCGPVPVFHLNGGGADHFPQFAEPPRARSPTRAGPSTRGRWRRTSNASTPGSAGPSAARRARSWPSSRWPVSGSSR
jgi:hypothetical protein